MQAAADGERRRTGAARPLNRGRAQSLIERGAIGFGDGKLVTTLRPGAVFGEQALLPDGDDGAISPTRRRTARVSTRVRTASAHTVMFSQLQVLSLADFTEVSHEHRLFLDAVRDVTTQQLLMESLEGKLRRAAVKVLALNMFAHRGRVRASDDNSVSRGANSLQRASSFFVSGARRRFHSTGSATNRKNTRLSLSLLGFGGGRVAPPSSLEVESP